MLTGLKVTAITSQNSGNVIQKNNASRSLPAAPLQFEKELKDDTLQLQQKELTVPFNPVQKKENKTGLPDNLKTGIENLSGFSMDDVKVHYNSDKPAQLNALAYAQGTDIHIAPAQEKHLPHEAWHVVQQKQGRVKATMQMKGVGLNDDEELEREADVMGGQVLQTKPVSVTPSLITHCIPQNTGIQFKRSKAAFTAEEIAYIKNNHHDDLAGYDATAPDAAIWAVAHAEYDKDTTSGKAKLVMLNDRLRELANPGQKDAITGNLSRAREAEEQKWNDFYESTEPTGSAAVGKDHKYPDSYEIKSRGYSKTKAEKPVREDPSVSPDYTNFFDPEHGKIHADENWGKYDKAHAPLKNNNLLWLQYRRAIAKHTGQANLPDQTASLQKLQSISRNTIINEHTNRSLFMSHTDGDGMAAKTYQPDSDEFAAILQAPNAISSFWILYDQADILNKTFDSIETNKDDYLNIKFRNA